MRNGFRLSLLLNLVLAVTLIYLVRGSKREFALRESALTPVSAPLPGTNDAPVAASPVPFQWSQIESSNYQVYVKNLRSIGCPDQTIHDIITADVDNLYCSKRRELNLDGSETGPWSRSEQAQLVSSLLGTSDVNPASNNSPTSSSASVVSATPSMPLVFQNVNLASLQLDDDQLRAIQELRNQFIDRIGGLDQDPNDPSYRQRWQTAQPEADEMLRGMLGTSAFQNYELVAGGAVFGSNPDEAP